MQQYFQNNHKDSHNKVESPDPLQEGSTQVHPSSWSRVVAMLEEDKRKKKRQRIYLLAACITGTIFLLSMGTYMLNDRTGKKVEMNAAKNTVRLKEEITNQNKSKLPEITTANHNMDSNSKDSSILKNKIQSPPFNLPGTENKMVASTVMDSPSVKQDSGIEYLLVQTPEKRKFNIKHINDFADTLESTPGMTIKVTPLLRYIWGDGEQTEKAINTTPVKEHNINKSPDNQN